MLRLKDICNSKSERPISFPNPNGPLEFKIVKSISLTSLTKFCTWYYTFCKWSISDKISVILVSSFKTWIRIFSKLTHQFLPATNYGVKALTCAWECILIGYLGKSVLKWYPIAYRKKSLRSRNTIWIFPKKK